MTKKTLLVFDMDGTLVDTSEGIVNCHKFAHAFAGKTPPDDAQLHAVIGGPLLKTYTDVFGFAPDMAKQAVAAYRQHYATTGVNQCAPYDNMPTILAELRRRGYLLGIATLKADHLTRAILQRLQLTALFDTIHGMDNNDTLTKSDLICACLADTVTPREACVMIGDSVHDAVGAQQAEVDFLPVLYGYGFAPNSCPNVPHIGVADTPNALLSLFR